MYIAITLLTSGVSAASENSTEQRRFPMLFNMVHHNPGEPSFVTCFDEPGYLKQLGYNGQIPKLSVQCGLNYDQAFPGVLVEPSEERMWIERHAHSVRLEIDNARKQGMPLYPFTDVLVIPKSLWEKYGDEMKVDGNFSIRSETAQNVMRAQVEELFRRYPNLDGITVRHGETYLHDTPHHRGTSPVRSPEEHTILINLLREEVCVKRNRTLIYRTWDFGKMHTNVDYYTRATDPVEPHPKLIFSIKHVNADFIRALPFNTTLGKGMHQQIVEVSVNQAGLYGRCSHPYYIGQGVIEGWREMEQRKGLRDLLNDEKIRGVWIWCWGDGWAGPYFDNELWNNINEYVMRRWSENPTHSEEIYFNEFATMTLGLHEGNLRDFRKLMMLATDATFLGQQSLISRVSDWWCRDHYLTAVNVDGQVKAGKVDECIAEKEKAVEMWKEAEELAAQITLKDPRGTEFMRVSTTYGRIKYQVIEQLWRIQLLLAEERINGEPLNQKAAKTAVAAYEKSYKEWRQLKRDNPCCPTLYVDHESVHCGPPFQEILIPLKKRLGI
ncbi:hypothetical protein JW998_09005 [candidate division KSB1 bacterium]|nr:hypothetical protein [candidate division KSB1 bacterium]